MIVSTSDFTGIYKLSTNQFTESEIQDYIDGYEAKYLAEMLGVELYNLFIADLDDGVPQSAEYLAIYNAFIEQNTGNDFIFYTGNPFSPCVHPSVEGGYLPCDSRNKQIYQSFGMKDMLQGFIYFEFVKDMDAQPSPAGLVRANQDVSKDIGGNQRAAKLKTKYNRAIDSYKAIQWYCANSSNKADYPTFKGINKNKLTWQ